MCAYICVYICLLYVYVYVNYVYVYIYILTDMIHTCVKSLAFDRFIVVAICGFSKWSKC